MPTRTLDLWDRLAIVDYDPQTREPSKVRLHFEAPKIDRLITVPFVNLPVNMQDEIRTAIDKDMEPSLPCPLTQYKRELEGA